MPAIQRSDRVHNEAATNDIVERLRIRRNPLYDGERTEAADEIERLQERCEGYKGQVKWGSDEIERLMTENNCLRAAYGD